MVPCHTLYGEWKGLPKRRHEHEGPYKVVQKHYCWQSLEHPSPSRNSLPEKHKICFIRMMCKLIACYENLGMETYGLGSTLI